MSEINHDNYLVLARKYRPQNFSELKGQNALVRTLTNAIKTGRVHHAYVLTGIRGVGKTTTARIIAKALNCENGPSIEWDENDPQCKAISAGNHVDVLEFDAASHTGVDDIRDLFEGVAYAPVQGKYKVYIIDEVHMLSKQAFNALLKTLEEPPAQVKFIFATTEVNKIPVTVLSRCQRFDLSRVPVQELFDHFKFVLEQEGIKADDAALNMVAKAADGSVRDGMSLLDQAIALSENQHITSDIVGGMLGMADRHRIYDLFEAVMAGDTTTALEHFSTMYDSGHDPVMVMNDLLSTTHLMTRLKVVKGLTESRDLSEIEKTRGVEIAGKLAMENISRVYQMLLTAVNEAKQADRPHETVEMALIRVTHLAALPALTDIIDQLKSNGDLAGKA